jgi:hypothetical protein
MDGKSISILNGPGLADRRTNPDRRRSVRRKVLRTGRAQWGRGHWVDCIIRNVSEFGAQIEASNPLPNKFDLVIGDQVFSSCCVKWRRGTRIGIAFEGRLSPPFTQKSVLSSCSHYAALCREISHRATIADREYLLSMADEWEKMARRYRRKSRDTGF